MQQCISGKLGGSMDPHCVSTSRGIHEGIVVTFDGTSSGSIIVTERFQCTCMSNHNLQFG